MESNKERIQTAITAEIRNVIYELDSIIKKAETAKKMLEQEINLTYTHSEINGIGDNYESLIMAIARISTFKQVDYYFFTKENK